MVWASNCCGMGQTWDTEIKKFIGYSSTIDWNTEICYSCNQSQGSGAAGLDYPFDLAYINSQLIVSAEKIMTPNTSSPYLVSVSTSGSLNWSYTETSYNGHYTKAIAMGNSDILVVGEKHSTPQLLTASKFDSNGNKVWTVDIPSNVDVQPTDLISFDEYGMLYGISSSGVHVALVDQNGNIKLNNLYQTSQTPNLNQSYDSQVVETSSGNFTGIYNYGSNDRRFSIITFSLDIYSGPTWHVATTGSDSTGDGSEDNPFATIQAGIDAASDGDTIYISIGEYNDNFQLVNKSLTLTGEDEEETIFRFIDDINFSISSEQTKTVNLLNITIIPTGTLGNTMTQLYSTTDDTLTVNFTNVHYEGENNMNGIYVAKNVKLNIDNCSFRSLDGGGQDGGAIAASNSYYQEITINGSVLKITVVIKVGVLLLKEVES
jgi:hypothetical protein